MRPLSRAFIVAVCVLAIGSLAGIYVVSPQTVSADNRAIILLCLLATGAELLQQALPRGAHGSIAFVPYLACVILAPSWVTPLAILSVKIATEIVRRAPSWKVVFNGAQYTVAISASVALYRLLGGTSLLQLAPISLGSATARVGLAAIVATVGCYFVNTALVTTMIALNSGSTVRNVWKELKNPTAASLDVMAGPMVFMFAWLYASVGPIATAAALLPLIGYRHAQKTNLELEQTNRELLELMVKSLEARDQYTSGHSRRVQHFSTVIARALGLSGREIERVSRAALLHDVGKIHEKYAPILSKSERLTPEEWKTMKEHPVDGANLTSTMTKLHDIVPAIRHHHENWDGTGYPDGLAGELIPLPSRIIRFADTIDAMTTQRPYRAPLTEAQVRAEIVRCRGTQFDPMITDKLLSSPLWTSLFEHPAPVESIERPRLSVVGTQTGHNREIVRTGTRGING